MKAEDRQEPGEEEEGRHERTVGEREFRAPREGTSDKKGLQLIEAVGKLLQLPAQGGLVSSTRIQVIRERVDER